MLPTNPRRPQRSRRRAIADAKPADFYCRYGRHYTYADSFERDPANLGICMMCAFRMLPLLQGYYPVWASLNPNVSPEYLEDRARREEKAKIDSLRRGSDDPGWIYYVEQADLIKVGYSVKPIERMKSYGPTATLLAIHPGTPALEREMHGKFRRYLARGREWYSRADPLLAHITSVREKFGDPSVFAYAYTVPVDKRGSGVSGRKGHARFQLIR